MSGHTWTATMGGSRRASSTGLGGSREHGQTLGIRALMLGTLVLRLSPGTGKQCHWLREAGRQYQGLMGR